MHTNILSIQALLNPSAHSGRARRLLKSWSRAPAAACSLDWQLSRDAQHLQQLVRAAQTAPLDALLLAGGDGSVQLAANALRGPQPVPLAILPAGSGNDFARELGVHRTTPPWQLLEQGVERRVDLGQLAPNGKRFCCVASVGFDHQALELIHSSALPRSRLLNVYAAVRAILSSRPVRLKIRWQGGSFDGPARLAAVTNTRGYGGGFLLTPAARIDDGLLDICVIGNLSRAALLMQFPRIFAGSHGAHPQVLLAQSPWVRIEAPDGPLPVCLDGERAGEERTPIELSCLPQALRVLSLPQEISP